MKEHNFVGYEYQDITIKRSMASVYADGYENFGWELEGIYLPIGKVDSVTMKLKRNRKIQNKVELTRLQRQFDACAAEIQSLELSKYVKASAVAYIAGVIGTAFMAGSVFAVVADMVGLCIVLGIPGLVGWVLPYLLYRNIVQKKTAEITPLIDQKYDEMYEVCKRANSLLSD